MLLIQINVNVFLFGALLVVAFVIGFALRSSMITKLRNRILHHEKEIRDGDAQILQLEKEKADLLRQMKDSKIPVITLNKPKDDSRKAN